MDYAALLQMIMSTGGALAANEAAAGDRAAARRVLEQIIKKYGQAGTPELVAAEAEQLGPSALESIETDPRLREAELGSLDALTEMGERGGLLLEDQVALNKVGNQLARREAAGRASIANDFAARGQLGSGAQLAMSLANQQDSANRAADAGANTAATMQRRYFDSILQRGRLAGDISDRDYRRQSDAARARDSIAAHNAAARGDAARYRNDVANQRFANNMSLLGASSGAGFTQANYLNNEASRKAEQVARTAAGIGRGTAALLDDDEDERYRY